MGVPAAARPRLLALAALLAAALPPVAHGLFEDEVGQYEWSLHQIGKPTALAYSAEAPDRVFVASASGVVASVLLKDGTMTWRRIASTGGTVRLLRPGSRAILSVTDSGLVQSWKGTSGNLTWQRGYPDSVVELVLLGTGSKQLAVVLRESEVEARGMTGKAELQWSVPTAAATGKARIWTGARSHKDENICVVAAGADGSGPVAVELEGATGKVLGKAALQADGLVLKPGTFQVVDSYLVILQDNDLSVYSLCTGKMVGDIKAKSKTGPPFRLLPWQRSPGVFAITDGKNTVICSVGSSGLKHLRDFEGLAVVGPVFSVHDDETVQPVAVAVMKGEGAQIQLLDPASGNVQPAITAKGHTSTERGGAQLLLVHELSSGEHRTLMSAEDHSLASIQGAKVTWVREEALASITQVVFYGRSTSGVLQRTQSTEEQGLAGHFSRLAEFAAAPAEIASIVAKWLNPSRGKDSAKPLPGVKVPASTQELRDFGASKIILAATRVGKVFALEATTSEIIWQKSFGRGRSLSASGVDCELARTGNSSETVGCFPWMQLMPSASAAYSELVVATPKRGDAPPEIFWVDPQTGGSIRKEAVPGGAECVSMLPLTSPGDAAESGDVTPVAVFDSEHRVHTMPSSSSTAHKTLTEKSDKTFHYEVDGSAQVVQGFVVGSKGDKLIRLWNLELGSVGEQILATASPAHMEWGHAPVHIKGDASILYKYINKNMIAVASESVTDNVTSLNLYALDAVTGHVLHMTHVKGGVGPVHLAVCDNWIAMHYHNPKRTRYEILVVEFFQAKTDDGPWDILFGGKGLNHSKSGHHLDTPVSLQQTYIFPAAVSAMGVTATLQGITPRSVIMALTTDQVFRLSKDLVLNPRRPHDKDKRSLSSETYKVPAQFTPTADEPLALYAPLVPVRPTDVISYHQALSQVRGIVSTPTSLESTSLVFCYGLDLFFSPVQSAKAYDVLSPGFNYITVFAAVGCVVTGLTLSSLFAKRRTLQERWK